MTSRSMPTVRNVPAEMAVYRSDGERLDHGPPIALEVTELVRAAVALMAIGESLEDETRRIELKSGATRVCAVSFDSDLVVLDVSGQGTLTRRFMDGARRLRQGMQDEVSIW